MPTVIPQLLDSNTFEEWRVKTNDIINYVNVEQVLNNYTSVVAPTVNDDVDLGYSVGSRWVDTALETVYECVNNTNGAAFWIRISDSTLDNAYADASAVAMAIALG